MFSATRRKRLGTWIAILAMLMTALAPTLSHALSAWRGTEANRIDICTVADDKSLTSNGVGQPDKPAPKEGGGAPSMDCAYCLMQSDNVALPPSWPDAMLSVDAGDCMPALFYQSANPLFAWVVAQPRAPPAGT